MDLRRVMRDWRRPARWAGGTVAGCLVVCVGWYWLTPWGAQFRLEREVGSLCGGVLDVDDVLELALADDSDSDVEVDDRHREDDGRDGRWAQCEVGPLAITVAVVDDDAPGYLDLAAPTDPDDRDGLPVPLSDGWSGYVSPAGTVVVSLPCTDTPHTVVAEVNDERLQGFFDSVFGWRGSDAAMDDPAGRLPVARFAAGTAVRAAQEWQCQVRPGGQVQDAPLPVSWEEYETTSEADGTCAGLPLHRDVRIGTVLETRVEHRSLVESCVLGNQTGVRMYEVTAYYGPSAQTMRYHWGDYTGSEPTPANAAAGRTPYVKGWWASARCPTDSQRALFEVSLVSPEYEDAAAWWKGEPHIAREVLEAFAQQSADRHGCTDLRLP